MLGPAGQEQHVVVEGNQAAPVDIRGVVRTWSRSTMNLEQFCIIPVHRAIELIEILLPIHRPPRHGATQRLGRALVIACVGAIVGCRVLMARPDRATVPL